MSARPALGHQPSKKLRRAVRDAFDPDALARICAADDFSAYATRTALDPDPFDGHDRFYWHADNGASVLAVAHLDTVQSDRRCSVVDSAAGPMAVSAVLDDRLGAYVILELLPRLGIVCDWLLTTDEESCATTASDFDAAKDYDWLVSFDRGGTDVVLYDYDTADLRALVHASGAPVAIGSYSDICALGHLGCAGVNWGVGYRDWHSTRAHAWLDDTFRMVARYMQFHQANAGTWLPHDPAPQRTSAYGCDDDPGDPDSWLRADCEHWVCFDDPATYVESGPVMVCAECFEDDPELVDSLIGATR